MDLSRPLTGRQALRRKAILDATLKMADEGGYDAVQMRKVADSAEVALGTLYNNFNSKDHLLAELIVEWMRGFADEVEESPAQGDTTLERALDLIGRMTRSLQDRRKLAGALVGGLVAQGEHVAACHKRMHVVFRTLLLSAFASDFNPDRRDKIIRSLEHIWFSALICWKNGWLTIDKCIEEIKDAAEMFLYNDVLLQNAEALSDRYFGDW